MTKSLDKLVAQRKAQARERQIFEKAALVALRIGRLYEASSPIWNDLYLGGIYYYSSKNLKGISAIKAWIDHGPPKKYFGAENTDLLDTVRVDRWRFVEIQREIPNNVIIFTTNNRVYEELRVDSKNGIECYIPGEWEIELELLYDKAIRKTKKMKRDVDKFLAEEKEEEEEETRERFDL